MFPTMLLGVSAGLLARRTMRLASSPRPHRPRRRLLGGPRVRTPSPLVVIDPPMPLRGNWPVRVVRPVPLPPERTAWVRPVVIRPPLPQLVLPPPQPPRRRLQQQQPVTVTGPRSDAQNTHDSVLVAHLRKAVHALPQPTVDIAPSLASLRAFLKDRGATLAMGTLDTMERNDMPVMSLGMKETDVLHRVWQETKGHPDRETMLVQRLTECSDEAACASGRVARVVDTLSTFDERVVLKPGWALRQEWMDKASVLRSAYSSSSSSVPFSTHLRDVLTKEYVDTGLCTRSALTKELDAWGECL
jgi:hypothetical protein